MDNQSNRIALMADDTPIHSSEYQRLTARLAARELWEDMSDEERRQIILTKYAAEQWMEEDTFPVIAALYDDKRAWGKAKAIYSKIGGNGYDLEQAAKQYVEKHRNGIEKHVEQLIDSTRFPFMDLSPKMPSLPAEVACISPQLETWLSTYVAHSQEWAPRAAPGYHAAVGLWVLSTVAARRIVVHTGSHDVFPTLFLAMIGESTLWTKTTTAAIGLRIIRRAGCGHLLSPDRTTPQFLLKLMAGMVPQDYAKKTEEEQEAMRRAYGF